MASALFRRVCDSVVRGHSSKLCRQFVESLEPQRYLSAPSRTAQNIDPSDIPEGSSAVVEEDVADGLGGTDQVTSVQVDWGDGNFTDSAVPDQYGTTFFDHVFPDSGVDYNFRFLITNSPGEQAINQWSIGPDGDQSGEVYNVAPTANLSRSFDDSTNTLTAGLTDASDPSPADTDAGFHYSVSTDFDSLATSYADAP